MANGVARSPSRLCSRDGKICCYGDALSMIFLLAFVSCFLFFVFRFSFLSFLIFFLHPGMSIFIVSLRLCSNHLLLSASTEYVFYSTCSFCLFVSFAPYTISEFFCFLFVQYSGVFFFVALIFRVVFFFVVLSYSVRQHLICLPCFFSAWLFSVSL